MAPGPQDDSKNISADQAKLICEFANAVTSLTPNEWEKLADKLEIKNGKAA